MTRLLLCAGDASGELHAAALVEAFRKRVPEARFLGVGGAAMEAAGVELVAHQRELAVGGLVEVLRDVPRVVRVWRRLSRALAESRPDLAVLVDSPDFNIPFARRARRAGVPVLYFVSPQVWAWRRGRLRKLARRVDRMAVIFPFETGVYAGTGLRADFVGHPLVDRLAPLREGRSRADARRALGLDPDAPLVLLLPGSRRNELRTGLPLQLDVARRLHARHPRLRFAVALASSVRRGEVEAALARAGLPELLRVELLEGVTHEAVRAADVALAKPGTVTVEIALLGTPMVVAARVNAATAFLARRIVRLPAFSMPNLIAGEAVVPELLQEAARPERVAAAVEALLEGPAREAQLARLAKVCERLGPGGAAERAAQIAEEMVRGAAGA